MTDNPKIYCYYDQQPVYCRLKFRHLFHDRFGHWPDDKEEDEYMLYDFKYDQRIILFINTREYDSGQTYETTQPGS